MENEGCGWFERQKKEILSLDLLVFLCLFCVVKLVFVLVVFFLSYIVDFSEIFLDVFVFCIFCFYLCDVFLFLNFVDFLFFFGVQGLFCGFFEFFFVLL